MLGLVVTDFIYRAYPDLSEGELAKLRAGVVSRAALARAARELELGELLRLGKGERSSGGRGKSSILADALEAIIGAVYIDGGWSSARDLVMRLFEVEITEAAETPGLGDFKTRLQEHVARIHDTVPRYVVDEEGPDHEKRFYARVVIGGNAVGRGEGRSKKQAEQAAAEAAWSLVQGGVPDQPAPVAPATTSSSRGLDP